MGIDLAYRPDPLDALTEEHLRRPLEPALPADLQDSWLERFQYDLYDWNDRGFVAKNVGPNAYYPVLLTQGYFMMVSQEDYLQMIAWPDGSPKLWHVKVRYDERGDLLMRAYAARRAAKEPGAKHVTAHRELLDITDEPGIEGEHVNGWGLDNRRVNLKRASGSENIHNCVRARVKHVDLPRGVEKLCNGRYGGKICKRYSRKKVVTTRSKKTWATPEGAAKWYQNSLKKRNRGRAAWAHEPKSVSWPLFPPRLESEQAETPAISTSSHRDAVANANDIPF